MAFWHHIIRSRKPDHIINLSAGEILANAEVVHIGETRFSPRDVISAVVNFSEPGGTAIFRTLEWENWGGLAQKCHKFRFSHDCIPAMENVISAITAVGGKVNRHAFRDASFAKAFF